MKKLQAVVEGNPGEAWRRAGVCLLERDPRLFARALLIIEQIVQAHDGAPAMPAIVAHWPSNSLDASADAC
ncbi:MAG: hypothetical protein VW405_20690 [Rhodospirillaceae bacterium]